MLLVSLYFPSAALAQDIYIQETVRGGIAVDASGVSTHNTSSTTWASGPDLEIEIPATATVTEVYAVATAKNSGFPSSYASGIEINGVALSSATLEDSSTRYAIYSLDPTTFGITAAGSYSYEELGGTDTGRNSSTGVVGVTLYVLYEDDTLFGRRHVTFGNYYDTDGTWTVSGLPTSAAAEEMTYSQTVGWECHSEQDGTITVDGVTMSTYVGGRDDSPTLTNCSDLSLIHI